MTTFVAKPPLPRKKFDRENKKGNINIQPIVTLFENQPTDINLTSSFQKQHTKEYRNSLFHKQTTNQSVFKGTKRINTSSMSDFK